MPLIAPDMHYALKEIEAASGVGLSGMTLVEVPIIDCVAEWEQLAPILQAFGIDPNKYPSSFWPWWAQSGYDPNQLQGSMLTTEGREQPGCVVWRPFEGLPANTDPSVFLGAPGWDYSGFILNLIDMLELLNNTAVYIHCQLGADRTGAAHIGYLMKAKGLNLADASAVANSSTSAGPPNADYQRLVEAYSTFIGQ